MSLLQCWEVVFLQEARDKTRSSGTIVPGDEADCFTLDALHLVNLSFLAGVPYNRSILHKRAYKGQVCLSFAGFRKAAKVSF